MDVPGERLPSELPGYLRDSVAPEVPRQLREAFLEAVEAGRIRSMQNKLMPAAPIHRPGALLLGDAFNMRHPLTGGNAFCRLIMAAVSSHGHLQVVLCNDAYWQEGRRFTSDSAGSLMCLLS